ncbi:plasmid protein [Serratia marcescens]|uniref:plasmid protein n=1 Tax=Serratia marcescens TaxID=615 RepID=UPI00280B513F|nr:plasmid protein [Serratia marcescens]
MTYEVMEKIISLVDYQNMISPGNHPSKGQFVVTGTTCSDNAIRLGYCVQVRKGRGQFGSDMIFLRHPDGTINTHENQFYLSMTDEQTLLARSIFSIMPENEDDSRGYCCCGKIREVGFIVENSGSVPTPDHPFVITVSSEKA